MENDIGIGEWRKKNLLGNGLWTDFVIRQHKPQPLDLTTQGK